jgi:hypothetical protein
MAEAVALAPPRRPASDAAARIRAVLAWPHLPGVGLQVLLSLWLVRRLFTTAALPAGTDALGFIARARANAAGREALSLWSPESFGAVRQITLETPLGVLTKLTGDPVLTVKLFTLATLLGSALGAYLLAWRWFGSRPASAVAGVLYAGSQISLSQTASGHLNVMVAVALAPALLLTGTACLERFTPARALRLTLVLAALVLARPDMPLYLVPFLALYVPIWGLLGGRLGTTVRNTLKTAAVAGPALAALSLYAILPLAAGVRAAWLSSGGLFTREEFADRSLQAFPSLLGFGREIGYLAFTGQQTWYSHPWLPFAMYCGLAAAGVALAYAALRWLSGPRALFLAACALVGAFLAKGLNGPLGEPYAWMVQHVPVMGNIRDPNRWLIVATLAYAVLTALALARLAPASERWVAKLRPSAARPAAVGVTAVALALLLLPQAPTLVSGLRTWSPTRGQQELLSTVARDPGQFAVATVPFGQTRRFVAQGGYRGWEHDLGAESALFTGHPALGDGGWNRSASDEVAYLSTLVRRADPAFARVLGALGVKYVLEFAYAPTAPHLVNRADPHYQQHALAAMPGLDLVRANGAGRVWKVRDYAPAVSVRPNRAVVLGGRAGLAALASLPGISVRDWAAEDAASLVRRGGVQALTEGVRSADLVVLAGERPDDIAMFATPALATLAGATSDPGSARATQTVAADASTRLGSLSDDRVPDAKVASAGETVRFNVAGSARPVELWARVRYLPGAGRLRFLLDGRHAGDVVPVALVPAGFTWVHLRTETLAPGRHRFALAVGDSRFGRAFDLEEGRIVDASALAYSRAAVGAALAAARPRTASAFELDDASKWSANAKLLRPTTPVGSKPASFWSSVQPSHVQVAAAEDSAATLALRPDRRYHSLVQHRFARPQDWRDRFCVYVRFRGSADGRRYRLNVDADRLHRYSISLPFRDDHSGWHERALMLPTDSQVLGHVVALRIAADDQQRPATLAVGGLTLSPAVRDVELTLPAAGRDDRPMAMKVSTAALRAGRRVSRAAERMPPGRAAMPARTERVDAARYRFSVDGTRAGTLVVAQALDTHWRATVGRRHAVPTSAWAGLQGYDLRRGEHAGTVEFAPARLGIVACALSLAALAVILLTLGTLILRREASGRHEPPAGTEGPLPGATAGRERPWIALWELALLLLALAVVLVAVHRQSFADGLAVAFTAVMTGAVMLVFADAWRRRRCGAPPR